MAGFLKGGPRPSNRTAPPKGAHEFLSKSSSNMPMPHMPMPTRGAGEGGGETKILHHPSGEHEVHHADGEVSKHPNAGHMAAHLHAKHAGGEAGNMHRDDMGAVTTHNVGPDGEVNGPTEHASPEEGANHLAMMMGGENEMPNDGDGDEASAYA